MSGLFFSGQDKVTGFPFFFLWSIVMRKLHKLYSIYLYMYVMGWEDMKFLYLNCGLKRIFSV